jgi:hypothetical protein
MAEASSEHTVIYQPEQQRTFSKIYSIIQIPLRNSNVATHKGMESP